MSRKEHEAFAPETIGFGVLTISDTRTKETDKSGKYIVSLLEEQGYFIEEYEVVTDTMEEIKKKVITMAANPNINVVLTNGGTGIAKKDVTIETIRPLLQKEISGFGELFRMLSYTEDIGSAAILSRALAGIVHDKAVFAMPGSTGAVKLAMNRLILPEIKHIVGEIERQKV